MNQIHNRTWFEKDILFQQGCGHDFGFGGSSAVLRNRSTSGLVVSVAGMIAFGGVGCLGLQMVFCGRIRRWVFVSGGLALFSLGPGEGCWGRSARDNALGDDGGRDGLGHFFCAVDGGGDEVFGRLDCRPFFFLTASHDET